MKKAVIKTGGKQYVVSEGQTVTIERIKPTGKAKDVRATAAGQKLDFEPLMVIEGEKIRIGAPTVDAAKVTAEVVEADVQSDKVTSIRYKSKKRVHKVRGHRQRQTVLKISKIV
ncbi:MAG: 50S ribosomal protein L21 [Candidatus Saccharimonadales bacterium]